MFCVFVLSQDDPHANDDQQLNRCHQGERTNGGMSGLTRHRSAKTSTSTVLHGGDDEIRVKTT